MKLQPITKRCDNYYKIKRFIPFRLIFIFKGGPHAEIRVQRQNLPADWPR